MTMSSGRTSIAWTRRDARLRRPRRAGCGFVRGRTRLRPGRNQGPLAGRAPMTAIVRSGRRRAPAGRDAEARRCLEVESLLDLDGRDLVAQPELLLARGVHAALPQLALARGVHPTPAGLMTRPSLAHR